MRRLLLRSSAAVVALAATMVSGCLKRDARPSTAAPATSVAALPASPTPEPTAPPSPSPAAVAKDVLFETTVRPILSTRCTPCHWPGGRMYERMPFDDPRTITGHLEGVRRRLKGGDRDALEKWIASLPPR